MKKICLLTVFLFSTILISTLFPKNKQQNDKLLSAPAPEDFVLNNASLGNDFWVAIPQNDVVGNSLKARGVEIVVTSPYDTEITLEIPEVAYTITKKIKAFDMIAFSSDDNDVTYAMEVTESETITQKGIHLFADKPFAVWVINSKRYSSEGYMAIPTANLGTEYNHCAYYDQYTNTLWDRDKKRGAGFIVIANEQGTRVTIELKGTTLAGATVGGKKPGDNISVNLNAGDTYMVCGNGETVGQFDLSGTKITGSKPIGVISFHMRTQIPSIAPIDLDNLVEMVSPVPTWGKTFYTLQLDRKPNGSKQGKGDLFRIINKEAKTNLTCEFYDLATYLKAGTRNRPFNKANMFSELDPITDINSSNTKTSIFGMAQWTSDKPVMLMQYSFSNPWDGDTKWSPLNILVPPVKQYVRSFIFTTPLNTSFQEHQLTLIVKGEPSDPESALLRSVKIDGKDLWRSHPALIQNRIPNSEYYWIRLNISTGAHYVQSNTLLYGYLTGFDSYNAYGYPAVHGFNIIDNMDTAAPKVKRDMSCGNYDLTTTELTNGSPGDDPKQVDAGISKILLIESKSFNYILSIDNPKLFKPQNKITSWDFYLNLVDNTKPGKAVYAVLDRAGNLFMDSVSYDPPNIEISPAAFDFGKITYGSDSTYQVCFKNNSNDDYLITAVNNDNDKFVLSGLPALPMTLTNNDSILISVTYTPTLQSPDVSDIDTIYILSDCVNLKTGMSGKVIYPTISVTNSFDFGKVLKGEKVCMEDINKNGLEITNTGTSDLIISSVSGISAPFQLSSPTDPLLPITVKPDETIFLKSICFIPQDTVKSQTQCKLGSNAAEGDSVSILTGEGYVKQDPTSVDDDLYGLSLDIAPNPAEGNFKISWTDNSSDAVYIEIMNIQGLVIDKINTSHLNHKGNILYPSKSLVPGIYLVRLSNGFKSISKKLIILK